MSEHDPTVIEIAIAPRAARRHPPAPRESRVPIVARTLALAHKMQAMIDRGEVRDQAQLAALTGFTRARITQIVDLTLLAPDIQTEILFAEETGSRDVVSERELRKIVQRLPWRDQRARWRQLRPAGES